MRIGSIYIRIRLLIAAVFLLLLPAATKAQSSNDSIKTQAIIFNGDTLSLATLNNLYVYGHMTDAQREARAKYNRLRNAVYVTYPYARRAGIVMNDINEKLASIQKKNNGKSISTPEKKNLKRNLPSP
jgi:hypothetical protein